MKPSHLLLLALMPLQAMAGTQLTGTILGADGKPLPLAHAHLLPYRGNIRQPLRSTGADRDGHFTLALPESGFYRLVLTGVDHDYVSIPLLVDSATAEVHLTARLAPLKYKEQLEQVRIIGDWNGFNWERADTMKAQANGTFIYERAVQADTLAYQLLDITASPRSVNGTAADYFTYDGGGDYISVVHAKGGKATILFEPDKLLRTPPAGLPEVRFTKGAKGSHQVWEVDRLVQQELHLFQEAAAAYQQSHQDMRNFSYDWSTTTAKLGQYLASENELLVRQFAAVRLAALLPFRAKIDSTTREEILRLLPASSPMWALEPQVPFFVHRDRKAQELFTQELLQQNPDRTVRALALASLASMAHFKGDSAALATHYAELKDKYGDVPEVQYYVHSLDPNRRIAKGKPVPSFAVRLLDTDQTLTDQDLRGRYYLLDFWATWCGPCIGEMPHLHAAFERFKDKNFTILSLSLDRTPEDVARFRQKKWPMPWMHTFLSGGPNNEIARAFEVMGIPRAILVGPDGTMLELDETLRGEGLVATLAKYLGK